jgi:hypothetical protein
VHPASLSRVGVRGIQDKTSSLCAGRGQISSRCRAACIAGEARRGLQTLCVLGKINNSSTRSSAVGATTAMSLRMGGRRCAVVATRVRVAAHWPPDLAAGTASRKSMRRLLAVQSGLLSFPLAYLRPRAGCELQAQVPRLLLVRPRACRAPGVSPVLLEYTSEPCHVPGPGRGRREVLS